MKKSVLRSLMILGICFSMHAQTAAQSDSVTVKVKASFVVDKTGEITNVKIVESDCKACSSQNELQVKESVIQTIKSTPNVKPGKNKSGQPVNQKYILPVTVVIKKDS